MNATIATCLVLSLMADPAQPDRLAEMQRQVTIGQIGLGAMGIGAGTLLFVTIPAWRLYDRALEDAADERTIVTQDEPLRRARTRRALMYASLGIGSGFIAIGATIAITGYARRNRMRNAPTLSFAPVFDDTGVGGVATLRF